MPTDTHADTPPLGTEAETSWFPALPGAVVAHYTACAAQTHDPELRAQAAACWEP
jgi:hypothetical protein